MIIILCPECYSTKIEKYKGKMSEKGHDWLHCTSCKKNFPWKNAGNREERDLFE